MFAGDKFFAKYYLREPGFLIFLLNIMKDSKIQRNRYFKL